MNERMDNMNLVFIITTRCFPLSWDDGSQLDVKNLSLDFDNNAIIEKKFEKNPYAKTRRFGLCDVFVLPCTYGGDLKAKCHYWEEVFRVCIGDGGDPNRVCLLAHDKDFVDIGTGVSGDFVKQNNIKGLNCKFLEQLVDIRHAYMYQHGETEVGRVLSKLLKRDDKDGFADKDCDFLLNDIIVGKKNMIEFFKFVDDNSNYKYSTFP